MGVGEAARGEGVSKQGDLRELVIRTACFDALGGDEEVVGLRGELLVGAYERRGGLAAGELLEAVIGSPASGLLESSLTPERRFRSC